MMIASGITVSNAQAPLNNQSTSISYDAIDSKNIKQWDKLMSNSPNISRTNIASLTEAKDIELIHRGLTLWLLTRLELLANETNKDVIKVSLEEVANRFYLLDKVAKNQNLTNIGKSSILEKEQEKVKLLMSKHSGHNTLLSTTVDEIFQKQGLLKDEHVIYMLSNWMEKAK